MNLLLHLRLSLQPPHCQASRFSAGPGLRARQLSLRPALHALASTCLRQTRGYGVQEGGLLEASPGEAGPGAALQGAVTGQEAEPAPALKCAHVD